MSKKKKPRNNYVQLIKSMDAARHELDKLPDNQEFTREQLKALDDLRGTAVCLTDAAEATILMFNRTLEILRYDHHQTLPLPAGRPGAPGS